MRPSERVGSRSGVVVAVVAVRFEQVEDEAAVGLEDALDEGHRGGAAEARGLGSVLVGGEGDEIAAGARGGEGATEPGLDGGERVLVAGAHAEAHVIAAAGAIDVAEEAVPAAERFLVGGARIAGATSNASSPVGAGGGASRA